MKLFKARLLNYLLDSLPHYIELVRLEEVYNKLLTRQGIYLVGAALDPLSYGVILAILVA